MPTIIGGLLILLATLAIINQPTVLGVSTVHKPVDDQSSDIISQEQTNLQPIKTTSLFSDKLEENTITIPKQTVYKDDPETEAGIDTVLEEGKDGHKTTITKITFYEGIEYSRETVGTETVPPENKIISRGTKIVWKELSTDHGSVTYWKRIRVWATHYDSHCPGCDEWTATGMRQGKGVIAVDPKVIRLGTKVYIPGYGYAVAGDTGGAIKGNIIDLGFDDARTAGWRAQFVDIYLIS